MTMLLVMTMATGVVSASVVMHEYHTLQTLSPLTSYSSFSVTTWKVPMETKLSTWSLQTASESNCKSVNITV